MAVTMAALWLVGCKLSNTYTAFAPRGSRTIRRDAPVSAEGGDRTNNSSIPLLIVFTIMYGLRSVTVCDSDYYIECAPTQALLMLFSFIAICSKALNCSIYS
jgi:hypothetical protein